MRKILLSICFLQLVIVAALAQTPALQEGLSLKYLVQLPSEKSRYTPVIILLHGYGSDEKDLFELRDLFPENYLVVAARAPYPLQSGGYEWYEGISANGKRDGKKDQLESSRNAIVRFIDEVTAKYKADKSAVYVVGFSQGAVMSYQVGLTAPSKVKGIGPLSGMIFASLKPEIKVTPSLKKLKIFVSHGSKDDRITYADGKESVDYLKNLGLNPEFHTYQGMGHSISNEVMRDLLLWLGK